MEKNNKNLNVPNLRFPEFSGEWERCKVKDFTKVVAGATPSTSNKEYWGGDIRWMNSGELNLKRVYEVQGRITQLGYEKTSTKIIPPQSVLIGLAGQGKTRGTAAINYVELCTNQSIASILPSDKYYPEFLYQNIESRYKELRDISSGDGGRGGLNLQMIYNLNIPYCSISEQRKIGDFLCLLDQRIETQRKIIEKYESLIRGISNKLLYADNGIPIRLGDLLIERSERTKVNNQHEVLSSTVKGIFSQREYFSKDIASENNVGYKVIHRHDVVLSPQNLWMGNINYNDKYDIGIVSPSYKIFSIAEGYDKRFVAALLKTHRALYNYMQVSEQGASIVRRNLNMEAFEQLTLKMPPLETQREIGNAISALKSRLKVATKIKFHIELQKEWLLREMFI